MPQSSAQTSSCLSCCPQRGNSGNNSNNSKKGSRNFMAAGFSLLVIVLLTTSLTEANWFYLEGGGCSQSYIGVTHFFFSFQHPNYVYNQRLHTGVIDKCITADILVTLQTCLVLVIFGIFFTVFQVALDLVGSGSPIFKALQVNAVCNTITVLICVTVTGLCYWAGCLLHSVQEATSEKPGQRLTVAFSIGFYLVVAAGAISVLAAAANCFRHPLTLLRLDRDRRRVLSIMADQHQISSIVRPSRHHSSNTANVNDDDDDLLLLIPPAASYPVLPTLPCRRPLPPTPDVVTPGDERDELPPPPAYTP